MNKQLIKQTEIGRIIKKIEYLEGKYHSLSLLMFELKRSMEFQAEKCISVNEFKEHFKIIDLEKLKAISKVDIFKLEDIKHA